MMPSLRRATWTNAGRAWRMPRFEATAFPLRVQIEADLSTESSWSLLASKDPSTPAWRSPF